MNVNYRDKSQSEAAGAMKPRTHVIPTTPIYCTSRYTEHHTRHDHATSLTFGRSNLGKLVPDFVSVPSFAKNVLSQGLSRSHRALTFLLSINGKQNLILNHRHIKLTPFPPRNAFYAWDCRERCSGRIHNHIPPRKTQEDAKWRIHIQFISPKKLQPLGHWRSHIIYKCLQYGNIDCGSTGLAFVDAIEKLGLKDGRAVPFAPPSYSWRNAEIQTRLCWSTSSPPCNNQNVNIRTDSTSRWLWAMRYQWGITRISLGPGVIPYI